ncbi:MAG: hypothetical protein CVU49_07225 [Candidatus Cloacimonetes bacterium HGW-Cloacimonetes-2]|jgi:V/A-type H+-transporting ATPase subunit I|nr:MAG: hypothetical protein CVU49_07225 [Candidatus Cloacimonetes bacterium HGW-Cloacimonetes-2]
MIEKMRKYSFVLYHLDYGDFLKKLQDLGVLHIESSKVAENPALIQNQELMAEYSDAIKYLEKYSSPDAKPSASPLPVKAILNKVNQAKEELEKLSRQKEAIRKQIHDLEPWGHFDYPLLELLKQKGVSVEFYHCLKNHFKQEWKEQALILEVTERSGMLYFAVVSSGNAPQIEADRFSFHQHSLAEYEQQFAELEQRQNDIIDYYKNTSATSTKEFTAEIANLSKSYEYTKALELADNEAKDHLRVLTGWVPKSKEQDLKQFVTDNGVIHFSADVLPDDNPPIMLKNNAFSRLYETISKMYMLPNYNDFDLTPFFAPFFMLFFGFCNADMAYGVILIALAFFLKRKNKAPGFQVFMNLVITFGIASIVVGAAFGTILGFQLVENENLKRYVLVKNNEQIFNLALLLGAIQILFGVMINTIKQMLRSGFRYGLAPLGTFLFILALAVLGSTQLGVEKAPIHDLAKYPLFAGLALILLFNNPKKNIIINILGGLWLLYNVVTGFFGDILSYIRLFALGVSSAILGFVINSIGSTILGDKPGILNYLIYPIFMVLGHSLILALGALSAFVHPMRLTFVEFFKNAGFEGPGIAYKPFGNQNK